MAGLLRFATAFGFSLALLTAGCKTTPAPVPTPNTPPTPSSAVSQSNPTIAADMPMDAARSSLAGITAAVATPR